LLMKLSDYEETGGVYRESDEVATHGAWFETDLEYERRVRDVKRRKLNQPPPQRMVKPLFFSKFVCGASVPIYIKKIVEQYAKDTERAEERERIFHVDLAPKYCHFLVCIHPFEDGNGRLCRLLMNAILLEYADTIVTIGGNAAGRRICIEAVQANGDFTEQEYRDIPWEEQTDHRGLGAMILQKVLEKMKSKIRLCKPQVSVIPKNIKR